MFCDETHVNGNSIQIWNPIQLQAESLFYLPFSLWLLIYSSHSFSVFLFSVSLWIYLVSFLLDMSLTLKMHIKPKLKTLKITPHFSFSPKNFINGENQQKEIGQITKISVRKCRREANIQNPYRNQKFRYEKTVREHCNLWHIKQGKKIRKSKKERFLRGKRCINNWEYWSQREKTKKVSMRKLCEGNL